MEDNNVIYTLLKGRGGGGDFAVKEVNTREVRVWSRYLVLKNRASRRVSGLMNKWMSESAREWVLRRASQGHLCVRLG